ncbi:unnamed protein product [Lota lota]
MTTELEAEYKRLLAETEQYKQVTTQQKQRLSGLDNKLRELQATVGEQRWTFAVEQKTARLQTKHIRVLENRLEQSTWKLNRLYSVNLALRGALTHLLKPRRLFCRTYKQLHQELERQHHATNELVEKSILAYDQRSENLKRLVKVKDRYQQQESQGSESTMGQKREMEHEAKQRAFMVLKLRNPVLFSEDQESQETAQPAMNGELENENLEMLTEEAGGSDPQLHEDFLLEEDKFALFLFTGQLNTKIHLANSRIEELQKEILDFELDDRRCEEQCNRELKDMESKLEKRRSLVASLEQQYMDVRKALEQQKGTITNLFARMNCAPITGKFGCSTPVTDYIVTQFIGFLEELVHGLWVKQSLQGIQQASEHKDEEAPVNLLLASCISLPPPTISSPHILAPCEAHQPESELLMDLSGLRQHALLHMAELEQCSSQRAPSADQKGKKNVPHSSITA